MDAGPEPAAALPAALGEQLDGIAALHDPIRRRLYLYVAAAGRAVSRDEAAEAAGIRRGLAAFHLDRLAGAGLLDVEYRRLTGRQGPGAGRPAKLYRRSDRAHEVTLPPRHYDLAAEVLAEAVEQAGRRPVAGVVAEVARRRGEEAGGRAVEGLGRRAGQARRLEAVCRALADMGFEPYRTAAGEVRLRNCPFHDLARRHVALVCGMNEALLAGAVEGAGLGGVKARLDPRPGECCVALGPAR